MLGGHQLFVGVHQLVVALHLEDSFIRGLDLEITVPGGGFGIFDEEGPQAGLPEVVFQDMAALTVVHCQSLKRRWSSAEDST